MSKHTLQSGGPSNQTPQNSHRTCPPWRQHSQGGLGPASPPHQSKVPMLPLHPEHLCNAPALLKQWHRRCGHCALGPCSPRQRWRLEGPAATRKETPPAGHAHLSPLLASADRCRSTRSADARLREVSVSACVRTVPVHWPREPHSSTLQGNLRSVEQRANPQASP